MKFSRLVSSKHTAHRNSSLQLRVLHYFVVYSVGLLSPRLVMKRCGFAKKIQHALRRTNLTSRFDFGFPVALFLIRILIQ